MPALCGRLPSACCGIQVEDQVACEQTGSDSRPEAPLNEGFIERGADCAARCATATTGRPALLGCGERSLELSPIGQVRTLADA